MNELHLPWLEVSILIPLVGAIVVGQMRDPETARKWCLFLSGCACAGAVGAWFDFELSHIAEAGDRWRLMTWMFGRELFVIDRLSAPLFPLAAALHFLTILATLRTKIRRFSFSWTLFSDALMLATFGCKEPWWIIGLLSLATLPPYLELRSRRKPTRVYVLHMALFVSLMVAGWSVVAQEGDQQFHSLWGVLPLLGAVLVRSGIVPFHCWMTDLFEHATFGTALLFVTRMAGAYAAVRLVLPIADEWVLRSIGLLSIITAVYASCMALVQRDARRFFCYLFLSHSALIFVGLEGLDPDGLTGALCVWLSAGLSLAGLGLTLRAMEARCGRLSLSQYQGHYEHTPNLAMCFMITGLASVGFPGTLGFIGSELLVEGAVKTYPYLGVAVVIAAGLNGIAVVKAYFLLFTGTQYVSSVSLMIRVRERCAVLALVALILLGGIMPHYNISSRYDAAKELLAEWHASRDRKSSPTDQEDAPE